MFFRASAPRTAAAPGGHPPQERPQKQSNKHHGGEHGGEPSCNELAGEIGEIGEIHWHVGSMFTRIFHHNFHHSDPFCEN